MRPNDRQSSVWQAAFDEGLARAEAAFGAGDDSAQDFAESYAYLVEAESLKASEAAAALQQSSTSADAIRAGWARAFGRATG